MEQKINRVPKSPCIGTCLYDPAESACLGCKRTPEEISNWLIMTNEQKLEVLERIDELTSNRSSEHCR